MIKGATVAMTSADRSQRMAVTGANGSSVFNDVPLGEVYVMCASHRHYSFTPESIEYLHMGQNSEQNFVGASSVPGS